MFPVAGQTAGPNGLTFFEETHGTSARCLECRCSYRYRCVDVDIDK